MNNEAPPTNNAEEMPATDEYYACPICYDPINQASGEVRLSCSHRFHLNCVGTWLVRGNTICPYCRGDLAETERLDEVATPPPPNQEEVLIPVIWNYPPVQQMMDNQLLLNVAHNNAELLINDAMNLINQPGDQDYLNALNLINLNYNNIINNNLIDNQLIDNLINNNMNHVANNVNQTVIFPQNGLLWQPQQNPVLEG